MQKAKQMIYQLPTGKIIYITVEQFLELSDEELDLLVKQNIGEYARSPWIDSIISNKKKSKEDQEEIDCSIDYTEESEEIEAEKPVLNEEGPEQSLDVNEEDLISD